MDTATRQEYRQETDKKTEYTQLNSLLAAKHSVEIQAADVQQKISSLQNKLASYRREIADLDKEFHMEVIRVKPTEVVGPRKRPEKTDKTLLKAVLKAAQSNPGLIEKIQDELDL